MLNLVRNTVMALTRSSVKQRIEGAPTSSNGASSFHLSWECPPVALAEVSVTLTIRDAPQVDKLYFWALQASFAQNGIAMGAAHLGLQYHPAYPHSTAANWGGYQSGGTELEGSTSTLPSTLDNPNTRDYTWRVGSAYRLRIYQAKEQDRWCGSVTDLDSGIETVIRELFVSADSLVAPVMWTEAFCDCDDPSVSVVWSEPEVVPKVATGQGDPHLVTAVNTNYQAYENGGCTNTVSILEPSLGFVQQTNCERSVPSHSRLVLES